MPLTIAIIGAGIGGPAAAIGLARNGHHVTIYERAPAILDGVGFAFRIMPNADRCLQYLGVDTLAGGAVAATTSRMMDENGNVLFDIKENISDGKSGGSSKGIGTSVFAYRPTLQRQILDAAITAGVEIKTNAKVVSIDAAQTRIDFADGSAITVDLIIAADGVHSVARPKILNSTVISPRPTSGHSCLRFTIPTDVIKGDPVASHIIDDGIAMLCWNETSKRLAVIMYAVDDGRQYNFNCTHPVEMSARETSADNGQSLDAVLYNHPISSETVLSIYADFEPVAKRLLELADPSGLRVWQLMDMDEIPAWSLHHSALLGDAAHPLLPFGFSGAAMAIEDAATLSVLLPGDLGVEKIEERLALFEKIRKPRIKRVRETGRVIADGIRDKNFVNEYRDFLSDHDTVGYAESALQSV